MSTVAAPTDLLTVDEFLDWIERPENRSRLFELLRGRVVEMARPNEVHGFLAYNLGRILGNYTYVRGAGFVSGENGLLLHSEPDTAVGPDVMVYLEKRSYDALSRQFSSTMPTLVAEVLSPTDRPSAVLRKVKSYLDRGVRVVAVLSPEECTITLYRSNEFPQMFDETDTLTCPELPEFACPVADVFRLP